MKVLIVENADLVAQMGAEIIRELVDSKPKAVLGLATGSTPIAMYAYLVQIHKLRGLSFKEVSGFNLDEYIGLESDSPQSYRSFMNRSLFDGIDIGLNNTYLPSCGYEDDFNSVASEFENTIRAKGGIDLQILGIGRNGHIGFNEPISSLSSRTRVKTLRQDTIEDNSRFFDEGEFQPFQAMTMGIGTILEAEHILLMATGLEKAKAVRDAIEGPLSAMCPASALQLHKKVTVILDEASAQELENKNYYKWVNEKNKELEAMVSTGHTHGNSRMSEQL